MSFAARGEISLSDIPPWVDLEPYEATALDVAVQDGIRTLFRETQADLTGPAVGIFHRMALRIATQAGAERGANFAVVFDPVHQHLHVHHIRVLRDGAVMDRTNIEAIQTLRREQNLERFILDGSVTASLIIPDVRPGDVVESCWTISGSHRLQQDCYSDWISLGGPVGEVRVRVRAESARPIFSRSYGEPPIASVDDRDGVADHRWRVVNPEKLEIEQAMPSWQALDRSLQITQAGRWSEVASYFHPHYQGGIIPNEMAAAASQMMAQFPDDPARRFLAALALIRERMRYQALALGDGGFFPRELEDIWSAGYGDCKDAARSFVALARLVGVDAVCVLVSTRYGSALNQWLPSPGVFNHCIARVRLDGRVFWVDPTRRAQEADIEGLFNPHFGWALPLVAEGGELEEMPTSASRLVLNKTEKIMFGKRVSSAASVEMTFVYESYYADWMRGLIANDGLSAVAKDMARDYQRVWPSLVEAAPLEVEDFLAENRLTLRLAYTIPNPWVRNGKVVQFNIHAREFAEQLDALHGPGDRKHDIYLGYPRLIRRHVMVQMPRSWPIDETATRLNIVGVNFSRHLRKEPGARLEETQELDVYLPCAPASSLSGYKEIVKELDEMGLYVQARAWRDWFVKWPSMSARFLIWLGALFVYVLIKFWLRNS